MKRWLLSVGMVLAASLGTLGWQQQSARSSRRAWEYCTVQNWDANVGEDHPSPAGSKFRHTFVGEAEICYQAESGCRIERITSLVAVVGEKELWNDPYIGKAQQMAVDKAVSKLGSEGWRLVGAGPDPSAVRPNGESSSTPVRSILYFERPKP